MAVNADKLRLKVVGQDGREVFFKLKSSTPLKKLMDAYCKEIGKHERMCRFLFDGQRINPDHTAAHFDMSDEDIIDVFVEQEGGGGGNLYILSPKGDEVQEASCHLLYILQHHFSELKRTLGCSDNVARKVVGRALQNVLKAFGLSMLKNYPDDEAHRNMRTYLVHSLLVAAHIMKNTPIMVMAFQFDNPLVSSLAFEPTAPLRAHT